MSAIKHTGGEWVVATIDGGAGNDEVVTKVNGCLVNIAMVFCQCEYSEAMPDGDSDPIHEVSAEEAKANARLLAAAPELLSNLQFAVALLTPIAGHTVQVERMRAAIAKAQGGAQ